jgi:hypothetical protein
LEGKVWGEVRREKKGQSIVERNGLRVTHPSKGMIGLKMKFILSKQGRY